METATAEQKSTVLKGGEFLIKESSTENFYMPEMKNEEQNKRGSSTCDAY